MKFPSTVLISGANGQTAIHLAKALLHQDCKVLLLAHERTERVKPLADAYPQQAWLDQCDLNDYTQAAEAIDKLISQTGEPLQAVVHCAAVRASDAKVLWESQPQDWLRTMDSNVHGTYHLLRASLPYLIAQQQGKIVLIGSNVTRTGLAQGSAYAAAKAALANLTRSVAVEIAPYNIEINMVSPAPLDTDLSEDYEGDYLAFRQKYFQSYRDAHPANKLVSMQDMTETILSLLNLGNNSLSGEEIFLTGGIV